MKYAKVAVEDAVFTFDKEFDYIIPSELEESAKCGCRVTVPFGNGNRRRIGIIFDVTDFSESKRLKKISSVLDNEPLLNSEMLALARWIKDRTFCTLYEAAKAMLPTGINHKMVVSYAVNADADGEKAAALEGTEKEIFDYLKNRGVFVKSDNLFKALGIKPAIPAAEALVAKGLLVSSRDAVRNLGDLTVRMMRLLPEETEIKLTQKQRQMVDVLRDVGTASVKELCYFTGLTPAVANALVRNGAAEFFDREAFVLPDLSAEKGERSPIVLTDEQKNSV